MPRCTLCENEQQAGDACDRCGQLFRAVPRLVVAVPSFPDLELTRHGASPEPPDRMAELEPTAAPPSSSGPAVPMAELVATRFAPHESPPQDPFDLTSTDLEPTRAPPAPAEPAPRGPIACRTCGAAATGWEKLCLRCGMRLPVLRPVARPASPLPAGRRCGECGALLAGSSCRGCGARNPGA